MLPFSKMIVPFSLVFWGNCSSPLASKGIASGVVRKRKTPKRLDIYWYCGVETILSSAVCFNIELNTQELASLLNLNVLTQFAPEEPEVQALSNIVNQVEYFIARGNTHRTEIFVTLTNKSDNALNQLILIAKSLLTNGL